MASQREDYPDAAYYSLMNLLDSHDTERLLWTLTPGPRRPPGARSNAANVAAGKQRVQLASLIQFTVPGAPTVYYGDEVGLTGDDDPDDRRTYPWADLGGSPDTALLAHYKALATLRDDVPALPDGDFRVLLADDADETVALRPGNRLAGRDRGAQPHVVGADADHPGRRLAAGRRRSRGVRRRRAAPGSVTGRRRRDRVTLPPMTGVVLATGTSTWPAPAAPAGSTSPARGRRSCRSPGTRSPARLATTSTSARQRRRLRPGERRPAHRHVVHDHRPPERADRLRRRPRASTRRATPATPRTRSSGSRTSRSAGPTCSGRPR